jgi:hypothetical protein
VHEPATAPVRIAAADLKHPDLDGRVHLVRTRRGTVGSVGDRRQACAAYHPRHWPQRSGSRKAARRDADAPDKERLVRGTLARRFGHGPDSRSTADERTPAHRDMPGSFGHAGVQTQGELALNDELRLLLVVWMSR